MSGRKWFAVVLGLLGVAVIVRPRAGELDAGQLIALVGWLACSKRLDVFTALGVGLILAGNLLNLVRWPAGFWRGRRKA